ncbi:SUMO-activating enzyme subunit 1 [Fopius arisanus]|uniref:SUMO-activating enzyme subunit 1 n=1 Tax=Fopius arisanus TaxID=64838 RepID=A0A9R1T3X1_9HYME|nr:PREDICTED: SUMO-activating enzyme subunit 1 [Fopius arisanus]
MVEERNGSQLLTDAEAELYDRQIRLWGLESQKRLRLAKVLLIGLNGFGAEVAKNIILAGIKSIKFLDHRDLTPEDFCSQFFADRKDIGKNRAQASVERSQNLNSMVEVTADDSNIDTKPDTFFRDFDVVCASECTITQLKRINAACRKYNIKFFAGDVWGMFGYTFEDLLTHEYAMDVVQNKKKTGLGGDSKDNQSVEGIVNTIKKTENFVPFEKILTAKTLPKNSEIYHLFQVMMNYREKYGKDPTPSERASELPALVQEAEAIIKEYTLGEKINYVVEGDLYGQVSPVCAILGGVMGQEIIKAVSQREPPLHNLFLFDPVTMCGKVIRVGH